MTYNGTVPVAFPRAETACKETLNTWRGNERATVQSFIEPYFVMRQHPVERALRNPHYYINSVAYKHGERNKPWSVRSRVNIALSALYAWQIYLYSENKEDSDAASHYDEAVSSNSPGIGFARMPQGLRAFLFPLLNSKNAPCIYGRSLIGYRTKWMQKVRRPHLTRSMWPGL